MSLFRLQFCQTQTTSKQYNAHYFNLILSFSCSVNCFKDHGCLEADNFVIDSQGSNNQLTDKTNKAGDDDELWLEEIPEEYRLSKETLDQLKESEELKQLLTNPHLRNFLTFANNTHHPKGFLKIAMREPLFVEFADACLKVVRPELAGKKEFTDKEIIDNLQDAIDEKQLE